MAAASLEAWVNAANRGNREPRDDTRDGVPVTLLEPSVAPSTGAGVVVTVAIVVASVLGVPAEAAVRANTLERAVAPSEAKRPLRVPSVEVAAAGVVGSATAVAVSLTVETGVASADAGTFGVTATTAGTGAASAALADSAPDGNEIEAREIVAGSSSITNDNRLLSRTGVALSLSLLNLPIDKSMSDRSSNSGLDVGRCGALLRALLVSGLLMEESMRLRPSTSTIGLGAGADTLLSPLA